MGTSGAPADGLAGAESDLLPRRFGGYVLFDRVGRGGMADIYLARAGTSLGAARRVVVKEILPELSGDAHFAQMLIAEAKLVAGLRHANIAQVTDLGREGDRLFIAMEYVEGLDLNVLLRTLSKRKIALPPEFAFFLVREVLAALDFAHRATAPSGAPLGIVHRDVSPSNVLISFEGEVKLCDFGIAKATSAASQRKPRASAPDESGERSRIAGKAAYMAPEHARGEAIDHRADVFAAGIVLWELCAGRRLYRGSEDEMLAQAREGVVPELPERGLPSQADLQAILDLALARDPAERWPTAAAFARELDAYAVANKLFVSQLRFGAFLSEHFEMDVILERRERERAAEALEKAPAVVIEPVATAEQVALAAEDTHRLAAVTAPSPKKLPLVAIGLGAAAVLALVATLAFVLLR